MSLTGIHGCTDARAGWLEGGGATFLRKLLMVISIIIAIIAVIIGVISAVVTSHPAHAVQ